MTVSIETTFRSRLKNAVRPDVLEQLITHYNGVPEAEAIVRTGSQLSDDKLFLGFVTGVPSFRAVYGVLNDGVLDDIVGVSQKLADVSPKVAFGFLRSGKTIVDVTPDYAKMLVLGMAASMSNPFALVSFIENSGRIAVDAGNGLIFRKWFDDGVSLSCADQVAHFGYDAVSRAVLDYFKIGGGIFPVSTVVRPYADCAVGALGALRDFEQVSGRNRELREFVDYVRSPAGKNQQEMN